MPCQMMKGVVSGAGSAAGQWKLLSERCRDQRCTLQSSRVHDRAAQVDCCQSLLGRRMEVLPPQALARLSGLCSPAPKGKALASHAYSYDCC